MTREEFFDWFRLYDVYIYRGKFYFPGDEQLLPPEAIETILKKQFAAEDRYVAKLRRDLAEWERRLTPEEMDSLQDKE